MKVIGGILLSLPFVGIFTMSCISMGWQAATLIWCAIIASAACLIGGIYLLTKE